jgi:hypothetical protein
MIKIIPNFLTVEECDAIISLWNDAKSNEVNDNIYRFKGMDLLSIIDDLNLPTKIKIKKHYTILRLQLVDETIDQVEYYHAHTEPFSFAIFLNDDFEGGELIFLNQDAIKPTKGSMVYFTGDERHKVEKTIGKRFTLIAFLIKDILEKTNKLI